MFGAWQAGAWRVLAPRFKPDLVVGASVGSLNGYAIAAGWSAADLCHWWQRPGVVSFQNLPKIVHGLMDVRSLELEYAVVLVDMLRLKPRTVSVPGIRPEHLLASCAVPLAALPRRIDGRWYIDGGLLNPLPVWAAVELGATRILALNALPEFPKTSPANTIRRRRPATPRPPSRRGGAPLVVRAAGVRPCPRWGSWAQQRRVWVAAADTFRAVCRRPARRCLGGDRRAGSPWWCRAGHGPPRRDPRYERAT